MTLGQKIAQVRKSQGVSQAQLGELVGAAQNVISNYENDALKGGPDVETLKRISKALQDPTILSHYCDSCPVRQEIFIKKFPTLNNINTDPTVILMKVVQELREGVDALSPLTEKMLTRDFANNPDYQSALEESMIQVIGTARALEILKEQYMLLNILTPEKLQNLIRKQQAVCELHGHHVPEAA